MRSRPCGERRWDVNQDCLLCRYRQVPVNAEARTVLDTWLAARRRLPGANGPALFLSLKGQRLSTRAVDLALRRLGRAADVTLLAHTLRHTCLTGLVRAGHDIVLVAELAGHSRLETTPGTACPATPTDKPPWTASLFDY